MKILRKKDFIIPCDGCGGKGRTEYKARQGGWAGENVKVKETCSKCKGKKSYYDKDGHIRALQRCMRKLKKHVENCPEYSYLDDKGEKSEERFKKKEKANQLMEGKLDEIHKWYVELKRLFGVPKNE